MQFGTFSPDFTGNPSTHAQLLTRPTHAMGRENLTMVRNLYCRHILYPRCSILISLPTPNSLYYLPTMLDFLPTLNFDTSTRPQRHLRYGCFWLQHCYISIPINRYKNRCTCIVLITLQAIRIQIFILIQPETPNGVVGHNIIDSLGSLR